MRLPIFNKQALKMKQEILEKAQPLGHWRQLNKSGRQVCCRVCHTCLQSLKEVLGGELWCEHCQKYR
jgi:hypothetical protein